MGTPRIVQKTTTDLVPSVQRPVRKTSLLNHLADLGEISQVDLLRLSVLQRRRETSETDLLLSFGMVSGTVLARAKADLRDALYINLDRDPPNPKLIARLDPSWLARHQILPWRQRNGATIILVKSWRAFTNVKPKLETMFGPVIPGFSCPFQIERNIIQHCGLELAQRAEILVPENESCRSLQYNNIGLVCAAFVVSNTIGFLFFPIVTLMMLSSVAIISLLLWTCFKLIAVFSKILAVPRQWKKHPPPPDRWPVISILVPLFSERKIADQLVHRLKKLNYPHELLDIIFITEACDQVTQKTLKSTQLPNWIKTLTVPEGSIQTKPRALNFALNFCRGSIVGVYDAEDAPDPYQLKKVVHHFENCEPDVACIQGVLDYYNCDANWMSRCFSVEYATWFRVVLPTLQRLGMPVPLGGTTLFFRRDILDELGGWDAHNVTEDADLGVRLARKGYRTEMLDSVTAEEANNHPWKWVRQRSRWLKGFAITWLVHMRDPRALIEDIGWKGFAGIQILFAVTIIQFLLAPVLWSFWISILGFWHPVHASLANWASNLLIGIFLFAELTTILAGMLAVVPASHRRLMKWVPTLHFYFPLGALAAYKAMWELITKPYFWDKTDHGHSLEADPATASAINQDRRVSVGSRKPRSDEHAQHQKRLVHRGSQWR